MKDPWNPLEEIRLEGAHVILEPLRAEHVPALAAAAVHPEIWTYTGMRMEGLDETAAYVRKALDERDRGESRPFAIVSAASREAIGSTRYYALSRQNRNLEIGYTWLIPSAWRTAVNTECKFLLLRHAFESMGCGRVALRTDKRNWRSQAAIERLGARKEGILRKHMIVADGYVRDTVYYSIIDEEWPEVRSRLLARLGWSG
jgi:RimJ/RimL family protein N-acetyltransferase